MKVLIFIENGLEMMNKLMSLLLLLLTTSLQANMIDEQLLAKSKDVVYLPADWRELNQVGQAFKHAFSDENNELLWRTLKLKSYGTDEGLMIVELQKEQRGQGLFMIRQQTSSPAWLIQAPHADNDLYTGRIASKLYIEGLFKAGQWNTVSRHANKGSGQGSADQAHLAHSYWQVFTKVFAMQYPQGKIIQLHGFAKEKRQSKVGRASDIIVSGGTAKPSSWLRQRVKCLKKELGVVVRLYPDEVRELGGTTNAQGRLLRKIGHSGFMHIEMSKGVRKRLLKQQAFRQKLLGCLSD